MPGFYYFYFSIFIPATKPLRSQRSSGFMAVIIFRKHMTFLTASAFSWGWKWRHSAVPICTVILNCEKLDPSTHFPAPDKHPAWNFGAIEDSPYMREDLKILMHILLLLWKVALANNYHVCEGVWRRNQNQISNNVRIKHQESAWLNWCVSFILITMIACQCMHWICT